MLQTDRRHDPYPFTWEIPVAVLTTALLLFGFGVQLGRSLANWQAGADWAWPRGKALATSILAILAGHPAAGLDPAPVATATSGAVMGWIITVEIVLGLAATVALAGALRQFGPGRMRGMASPSETETALGLRRLRAHRNVIRPDLYPPPSRRER